MQNEETRTRLVKATIAFMEDTPLRPDAYERHLLNLFSKGELTISQVLKLLDTRIGKPQYLP